MLQLHLYLFHMASYGDRTSLAAKKQKPIRACQQKKNNKICKGTNIPFRLCCKHFTHPMRAPALSVNLHQHLLSQSTWGEILDHLQQVCDKAG